MNSYAEIKKGWAGKAGPFRLIKEILQDREFLSLVSSLALPVALQMLLSYTTNFLDTAMIGRLGTVSISAVGLASQYYTVCSYLIFGLQTGTGILLSQYFGSRDPAGIRKTMGLGLVFALLGSMVFSVGALFTPGLVMGFYTDSEATVRLGTEYLRIAGLSYPLYAVCCILDGVFCSTRKARYPVIASVISIVVNLCLNYCLIFGKSGFPELGIRGAAIATVLSRLAQLIALWLLGIRNSEVFHGTFSAYFGWTGSFLRKYIGLAVPVVMTEFIFAVGVNFYYVAYGRLGDSAVASLTIANSIRECIAVIGNGLFSATGVLVGNELGADHPEKAQDHAERMLVLSILIAVVADLLLLLFMNPMLSFFSVTGAVLEHAKKILLIELVFNVLMYYYGVIIVGILPAGGDTKASFLIDVSTVWLVGIPMAFLGVLVWQLPVWQVYCLVGTEHVVKICLCIWRYRQKKWVRNLTGEG